MVTIKDVAQRAGVNQSTVSRVLKDSSAISQKTKEKVRQAMDELGYVPNRAAQMLASGMTQCVGVVLPPFKSDDRISDPFFMEILTTINNEAKFKDYSVAIATGESVVDLRNQVELMYRDKRADGFIILYSEANDPVHQYLEEQRIPFVVVGAVQEDYPEAIYIDNDNHAMGREAVSYLQSKGHQKILFVTNDVTSQWLKERYTGYQQELLQKEQEFYDIQFFNRKDPLKLEELVNLIQSDNITALIIAGELLALRMIQFLSYHGINVPNDVSVVTFNNSIFTEMLHPYLTTFDINVSELGRLSFEKLLQVHRKKKKQSEKYEVDFILKERESVRDISRF